MNIYKCVYIYIYIVLNHFLHISIKHQKSPQPSGHNMAQNRASNRAAKQSSIRDAVESSRSSDERSDGEHGAMATGVYGGFHSHGKYQKYGWFIRTNPTKIWMIWGGTPVSGNLHPYIYIYTYILCSVGIYMGIRMTSE